MLFSANVGLQLPDITNTIDPNTPATRAVSLNERYMPLAEGSDLKARVFVVKADKNAMKMINGKQAMDPDKVVMGAGEVTQDNIQQVNGGGINLHSDKNALTLTWLGKEVPMQAGEDQYICGIIGGEYDDFFKETSEKTTDPALKKLALQLYNFYVKFNPLSAHNTRDAKVNLRVTAAFSTGWTKLDIKQTNVIDIRNWIFKARGTLLRFKVKRDTELVKPEAHMTYKIDFFHLRLAKIEERQLYLWMLSRDEYTKVTALKIKADDYIVTIFLPVSRTVKRPKGFFYNSLILADVKV